MLSGSDLWIAGLVTDVIAKKMQLDMEVSPPANDLHMGNLQMPKS